MAVEMNLKLVSLRSIDDPRQLTYINKVVMAPAVNLRNEIYILG